MTVLKLEQRLLDQDQELDKRKGSGSITVTPKKFFRWFLSNGLEFYVQFYRFICYSCLDVNAKQQLIIFMSVCLAIASTNCIFCALSIVFECRRLQISGWFACSEIDEETKMGGVSQLFSFGLHVVIGFTFIVESTLS